MSNKDQPKTYYMVMEEPPSGAAKLDGFQDALELGEMIVANGGEPQIIVQVLATIRTKRKDSDGSNL